MASGDTLIPDGVIDTFKLEDKATVIHSIVRSTDSGSTWASSTPTSSLITNSLTLANEPTGNIVLAMYTSVNNPYTQTTPRPVLEVDSKVIASNSHSKYKGALVGNQVSGKIQVGNGTNGYESKVLENIEIGFDGVASQSLFNGNIILIDTIESGRAGEVWRWKNTPLVNWTVNINNITEPSWEFLGYGKNIHTTPTHSTIALDNANSPASKWFEALEEGNNGVLAGVYGEELAYNSGTTSFDGDDDTFEQLTNGTITDLNGNTCRTFHGSIALNGKVK